MPLVAIELDFLQGFEKTGEHGERSAQFVRNIGDKIAAHAVEAVGLRHILDLHEPPVAGIGNHVDRQHAVLGTIRAQRQWPAEIGFLQVVNKLRLAHQIDDRLAAVGADHQPQLRLGRGVAEKNVIILIEQDNAIGQRLPRLNQHGNFGIALGDLFSQVFFMAIQTPENTVPGTFAFQIAIHHRRL